MLNPEHFAHFFTILSHINFAAFALILFIFKKVSRYIELENTRASKIGVYSAFWADNDFNFKAKNANESLAFSIRWKLYTIIRRIRKPFSKRNTDINLVSEDNFLIRFLPLFFYSGIYCIALIFLAGCEAQYSDSKHNLYVVMLISIMASYLYFLLFFIQNKYSSSWFGTVILNIITIVFALSVSYFAIVNLHVTWLHNFLTDYLLLMNVLTIIIAFLPFLYLFLTVFSSFFPSWLMAKYIDQFENSANEDLANKGL